VNWPGFLPDTYQVPARCAKPLHHVITKPRLKRKAGDPEQQFQFTG